MFSDISLINKHNFPGIGFNLSKFAKIQIKEETPN